MKQVGKKILPVFMMLAIILGTASPGATIEAKEKNKFIGYVSSEDEPLYNSIAMMVDNSAGGIVEFSTGIETCSGIELNKGKAAYLNMYLPYRSKVKSFSLTSSNKKVFKVVNKKQGKIKGVKTGNAKLTIKIKLKYSGKARELRVPVLKKMSKKQVKLYGPGTPYLIKDKKIKIKKGKTYTYKVTLDVRVLCSNHKYSKWKVFRKPTCSRYGVKYRKCKVCGTVNKKWPDSLGHRYGKWKVTKSATCSEKGEKIRVCSVCKKKDKDKIDKLPHQYDSTTHQCIVCGEAEQVEDDEDDYDDEDGDSDENDYSYEDDDSDENDDSDYDGAINEKVREYIGLYDDEDWIRFLVQDKVIIAGIRDGKYYNPQITVNESNLGNAFFDAVTEDFSQWAEDKDANVIKGVSSLSSLKEYVGSNASKFKVLDKGVILSVHEKFDGIAVFNAEGSYVGYIADAKEVAFPKDKFGVDMEITLDESNPGFVLATLEFNVKDPMDSFMEFEIKDSEGEEVISRSDCYDLLPDEEDEELDKQHDKISGIELTENGKYTLTLYTSEGKSYDKEFEVKSIDV